MPERIVGRLALNTHIPYRFLLPLVYALRWARATAYVCIFVGGVLAMIPGLQPPTMRATELSQAQLTVWAAGVAVTGGFAAFGEITGVWWGEYVGLLPLCILSVIYGVASMLQGDGGITRGLFLWGMSFLCLALWEEKAIIRARAALEARERGAGGHTRVARNTSVGTDIG
jgi:hypothetical protein